MEFAPVPGLGGLPKVVLAAPDGAAAELYLYGAHVVSWIPAGERANRLFLSARSKFAAGEAIRGGVPVCFPQFADQGPLPNHGFARTGTWILTSAQTLDTGGARAVLRLDDSASTRALWPHAFTAEMAVTVIGRSLDLRLTVANRDSAAFEFTAALHSYLRVDDVHHAVVQGLAGARYKDKILGRDDVLESASILAINCAIDRVYRVAPDNLEVQEPGRVTSVRATGFPDTVVWNPWIERGAAIEDLETGDYTHMLCIEAAAARAPVRVEPGRTWIGTQTLVAA